MKSDNNYIIKNSYEQTSFTFYHTTGHIGLKMANTDLTDGELLEYVSDSLTHEHIHKLLYELFNVIVCNLFDGIEHHFRNHALHENYLRKRNSSDEHIKHHETYKSYIDKHGFGRFLNYYGITQEDIIYANKICSNRLHFLKQE